MLPQLQYEQITTTTWEGHSSNERALGIVKKAARALTAAALLVCGAQAQFERQVIPDKELVIATKEAPPFVMKRDDGALYGISIDLWRQIADQLQLRYHFSEQATVEDLLKGVQDGSFDLAIAAVTATAARERVVDFTQPADVAVPGP